MATRAGFDLSDLQREILHSPGTVTQLLEKLTGESLTADVIRQSPMAVGPDNDLAVPAASRVAHRVAVLQGCTTHCRYLLAESLYVPERLPIRVRERLEQTSDPIGRVLVDEGLTWERRPIQGHDRVPTCLPDEVAGLAPEVVWSRGYRLVVENEVPFTITEWFLRAILG